MNTNLRAETHFPKRFVNIPTINSEKNDDVFTDSLYSHANSRVCRELVALLPLLSVYLSQRDQLCTLLPKSHKFQIFLKRFAHLAPSWCASVSIAQFFGQFGWRDLPSPKQH